MTSLPKDTRTRYQGVFARHQLSCQLEYGGACDCKPSYWGKVYDRAAGKARRTSRFPSPAAARKARADFLAMLQAGGTPMAGTMRVSAAIETFLQAVDDGKALNKHGRRYKPSAARDLRGALENHVKRELGGKRLGDVRRGDVQRLVDGLHGSSGSRVRSIVNSIHSLYRWARERDLVEHDPAALVRLPALDSKPRERVLTPGELEQLLAALSKLADRLPFALAAYAGMRRNEIRHLQVQHVDLKLGVVYVGEDERARKSASAKRAVAIVSPLATMLRSYLVASGVREGLLLPGSKPGGRNSGLLSFEGLQTRADKLWEPLKLERVTAHECRHTFVSWLDAAGVRASVISRIAGHAVRSDGAAVTQRYTHMLPEDLQQAARLLERFLASSVPTTVPMEVE